MKILNYKLFEATLKGSPAMPENYLEEYTNHMIQQYQGEDPRGFMRKIDTMLRLQQGNEEELENIGMKIVKDFYGSILEGIELDAKIVRPGDPEQMEMSGKMSMSKPPRFEIKTVEDEKIKLEIDKRKIVNNIIQGESFNTFKLFQLAKTDIENVDPELYEIYNDLIDDSYSFYWKIPEEQQVRMIQSAPEFGNYVQIVYKDNDEPDEDEEDEDEEDEQGGEEESGVAIKVRALDLCAMIHELVKGVYELIAQRGIPEDREIAQIVLTNTDTYWDEIEDLRYGPKIASDVRDFLNDSPNIDKHPNLREFVFGYLVDPQVTPNENFLGLIKGILTNSPEARSTVNRLVNKAISEIEGYEQEVSRNDYENTMNQQEIEEPQSQPDIDFQKLVNKPVEKSKTTEYSKLTDSEFKTKYAEMVVKLNDALDDDDMSTVTQIGNEMEKLKDEYQKKYNKEFEPRG
jgi:hypothetical protein